MLFRVHLSALLIVLSGLSCLAAETPLKEGQSFYRARGALLRDGWQPVVIYQKDFEHLDPNGSGDVDLDWIYAKPFWRHGFKEIEFCNGMEANYCGFHYRKKGRCLYLLTAGEFGFVMDPAVSNWWTYSVPVNGKCSRDAIESPARGRIRPGGSGRAFP